MSGDVLGAVPGERQVCLQGSSISFLPDVRFGSSSFQTSDLFVRLHLDHLRCRRLICLVQMFALGSSSLQTSDLFVRLHLDHLRCRRLIC